MGFESTLLCPHARHTAERSPTCRHHVCVLSCPPALSSHTALEAAQGSSGQIGQQQPLLKSSCFLLLHFLPSPATFSTKDGAGGKPGPPSATPHILLTLSATSTEGRKLLAVYSPSHPLCTAQLLLHMDPLPCCPCTHLPTNTTVHLFHLSTLWRKGIVSIKGQRSSPFYSPSRLLLLEEGCFPLPHLSSPAPLEQHKQEGEAEQLLPPCPSAEESRVGFGVSSAAPG